MEALESKKQFLTFNIGDAIYGIDICGVTEIIGIQPIAVIPEMPKFIKGIINLRGKIIPLIDVRLRINKEERAYDDRTCIIVANWQENEVGLIVDCVQEVINLHDAEDELTMIDENPKDEFVSQVIKGAHKVYMIMNIEKLIVVDNIGGN